MNAPNPGLAMPQLKDPSLLRQQCYFDGAWDAKVRRTVSMNTSKSITSPWAGLTD